MTAALLKPASEQSTFEWTPKRRAFVDEYPVDKNGTQAAIRAGFSPKTARVQAQELLALPEIKAAIDAKLAAAAQKAGVNQQWVLDRLTSISNRCMQAEQVVDRKGDPVLIENAEGGLAVAYTFQAMAATRSTELIGRHLGMFEGKQPEAPKPDQHLHLHFDGASPEVKSLAAAALKTIEGSRG